MPSDQDRIALRKASPIPKFAVVCLFVLVLFGSILGWVLATSAERNVLRMSNEITAQFVAGEVRKEFRGADELLTPKAGTDYDSLTEKVRHLNVGPHVERIKIWNKDKIVVWSDEKRLIGEHFPDNQLLHMALAGKVASKISRLDKDEHKFERGFERLLELYVPVRFDEQKDVQVVVEIYQNLDFLYADIARQKRKIWIGIVCGIGVMYLTLMGITWCLRRELNDAS